jgi:hypothetical protein
MRGSWTNDRLRLVTAGVLGALCLLAGPDPAPAQPAAPSAELTRVVGRVEILRKGQPQWLPAVIGARLAEGDDIRAFSGAQAELALPDTSTVVLAENSRLLLTKLEVDRQSQSRLVLLHLAIGKVRAVIAETALTLVRARQSNFAISTPTAVAAARGTIMLIFTDGTKTLMAVEPQPGRRFLPRIECITLATTGRKRQMVLAGSTTTDCATPLLTSPQFLTLSNPATAGANLGEPVVAPATANILSLITSTGPEAGPGVSFDTTGAPISVAGPSSVGVDAALNQPPLPSPPACASPPCNP